MTITRHHDQTPDTLDAEEVFRFLGYNPTDPAARAVVGLCMRYQLDPFAGHIIVIQGRRSPYVTRDGHLWLAHRSGQFDGMETLEEWVTEKHCYAKVAVWRKDMSHPFVYNGRCGLKNDRGGWDQNADKKAVANAEVRALKRAFPLQLPSIVDYEDDLETADPGHPPGPGSAPTSEAGADSRRSRHHITPGQAKEHSGDAASPGDGAPSDINASVTGPGDTGVSTGQEPPNAEAATSPTTPGDGKAGREARPGGRAAPGKEMGRKGRLPAGTPTDDAEQLAYDNKHADERDPKVWTT